MNCKRTSAALLAALLTGLSLAACTGMGGTNSSATSSSKTPAVSSAASDSTAPSSRSSLPQIKLTLAVDSETAAPLLGGIYAADKQDYFGRYGLNVTIRTADTSAAALDLTSSGTAQFAVAKQSTSFANALCSGKAVTAVAAVLQHSDAGILTSAAKKTVRPKQLENTTCQIAADIPLTGAMLKETVAADGGKAALVKTGIASADAAAALKGGAAYCGSYSWDGLACKQAGVTANFLFYRDTVPALDEYPCLLAGNNTFLKQHPQTAKDFLSAVREGYLYAAAHPDTTAKLVCAAVPAVKNQQPLVQRSLTWLAGKYTDGAAVWGQIDTVRWNRFYSWMNQKKLTSKAVPLGTGVSQSCLPQPTDSTLAQAS